MDNKLHIKETAATATKKTSETVDQVKQSQPAQATMAYVGGIFGKLKQAATNLKTETEVAIDQQKRTQK